MSFDKSVFVNCPFDTDYEKLVKPLLFTVVYSGYEPLISETVDSGLQRIEHIHKLISSAKYSIHDLSRVEVSGLPRYNMPFELGLDIGCRRFGVKGHRYKVCLILEKEDHRHQKTISDMAGSDPSIHHDEPENMVLVVRNWLNKQADTDRNLAPADHVWLEYNRFLADFERTTESSGYSTRDLDNMAKSEFIYFIKEYVKGIRLKK